MAQYRMVGTELVEMTKEEITAWQKPSDIEGTPPSVGVATLTDRQFGEGLWREKIIDYEEYLAFIGPGTVPKAMMDIIDTLADDDTGEPTPRKLAIGLVTGAKEYRFDHDLTDFIRQSMRWSVEELREKWTYWATL